MNKLAIVIPAYKVDFFEQTLISISEQTCTDFTLYVGNDGSDSDFESLINKYSSKINIVYKKFNQNLGGKNLVAHWKRCIDLIDDESWIWLFSDDDIMGPNCVDLFYKSLANCKSFDLFHFDVDAIDENNNSVFECRRFPSTISSIDFYKRKENDDLDSFVVEYIFSRAIYNKTEGFQPFDLAWGTDTATWIKFSNKNGIKTINGDKVYWRKSSLNITPNRNNSMSMRKFLISIEYYAWVNSFFGRKIFKYNIYIYIRNYIFYSRILTRKQLNETLSKAVAYQIIPQKLKLILSIFLPLIRFAKLIKSRLIKKNIQ